MGQNNFIGVHRGNSARQKIGVFMVFIGFRVEIISRSLKKQDLRVIARKYNKTSQDTKISNIRTNNQIIADYFNGMLVVGTQENKKYDDILNFALMIPIKKKTEAKRIVQIINVLGNDRIIKEKISVFTEKQSMLNDLPELDGLIDGLLKLDDHLPNITRLGYYYAPEVMF